MVTFVIHKSKAKGAPDTSRSFSAGTNFYSSEGGSIEMRLHGDELVSRVALRPSAPVSFTQAVARLAGRSSLAGHSLPQARSLTSATFVSQVPPGGIDHTGHKGHTGHIGGIGHID